MEEVISQLSVNSLDEGGSGNGNPYSPYYKIRGEEKHTQEIRRLDLLKSQKERRDNSYATNRGILCLIEEEEYKASCREQCNDGGYVPSVYVSGFNKPALFYADTLMLSEWMIEVPGDLETNWYILACPKGKRVLLVATNGRTKAYLKFGGFYKEWKSSLPGGGYLDSSNNHCVLDCVITEENIVYILDVLAWGNISMTDCEHEFRYFWLKSKFNENDYQIITNANKLPIRLIERYNCTKDEISNLLMRWPAHPDNTPVDGLLFYHKKGFYVKNYTPLVVWLYPFMVNEVISDSILVHEKYLEEKPANYMNQADFIEKFEKKMDNKKFKGKKHLTHSTSNGDSLDSSLNSSSGSLESFGSGHVHYIFKASNIVDQEMSENKKKKRRNKKGKNKAVDMDVADVSVDSAIGIMDESASNRFQDQQSENMQ